MTIATTPTVTAHAVPEDGDISMADLPSARNVTTSTSPYAESTTAAATATATATPPAVVPAPIATTTGGGIPMYEQQKVGAICCACCCDFRRAVIIVNAMTIGLSSFTFLNMFNPQDDVDLDIYDETYTNIIDDDQVKEELHQISRNMTLANAIMGGVMLVLAVVPLYGAFHFKVKMIAFGIVLHVASFIAEFTVTYLLVQQANATAPDKSVYLQPWLLYAVSAIVVAFFVYPHVGLIMEIQQGIMTPETYLREDYSCCCATRRPPPRSQL